MALDETILKLETNAVALNGIMNGGVDDIFYSDEGNEFKSLQGLYAEVIANTQNLSNLIVSNLGELNGTADLDISAFRVFTGVLTGNTIFTISGEIISDVLIEVKLTFRQDDTGQKTFLFPDSIYWEGESFPDIPITPYTQYLVTLISTDRGVSFLGKCSWF